MADYRDLLRRAIEALPENNGAARRQVYEKARNALVGQLRAINPPLPSREVTQHRLQLEDCIREVEQEATEQLLGGWGGETPESEAPAEDAAPAPEDSEPAEEAPPLPADEAIPEEETIAGVIEAEAETAAEEAEVQAALTPDTDETAPDTDEAAPDADETAPEAEELETGAPVEAEVEAEPEVAGTEGEAAVSVEPEAEPAPEEEAAPDEAGVAAEAAEEADTDTDPIASVIAAAEAESRSETTEPEPEPEPEAEPEPVGEPELEAEPEPEVEAEPETELEAESAVAATPDADEETVAAGASEEDTEPTEEPEPEAPVLGDAPTVSEVIPASGADAGDGTQEPVQDEPSVAVAGEPAETGTKDADTGSAFDFGIERESSALSAEPGFAASERKGIHADTSTAAMSAVREVDLDGEGTDSNSPDPQYAIDHAIATLDREASGEGSASDASGSEDDTKPAESVSPAAAQLASSDAGSSSDEEPGGNALTIFLVIFALLLAGAGGAGFWAWREGYVDFNTMFGAAQQQQAESEPVMEGTGTLNGDSDASANGDADAAPGNTTGEPDASGTDSAARVVGEEDTGTVTNETATPEEGTTGTENTAEGDITASDDAAADSAANGTVAEPNPDEEKIEDRLPAEETSDEVLPAEGETVGGEEAVAEGETPEDAVAEEGAQSLLLEASDEGTTGAVPFSGSVEWSRGSDELGQPTIMASAEIPARNLDVVMLIRKNGDPALPASHLMEIDFSVNENFAGGDVAGLPGVLMKDEELVQGVPLVGASARIVGSSFLFALSASEQDVQTNTSLLRDRRWIDLAMTYASGKRAIITLEKDDEAQAMFEDVMDIWASEPAPSAE